MSKTILLTGATGFLGSHLSYKLLEKNYKVVILKRSFSDIKRIEKIIDKLTVYNIDIDSIDKVFNENSIEIVIHTATNYNESTVEDIDNIIEANINYGKEILKNALKYNVNYFINTDTFYHHNYEWVKNKELYYLSKKIFYEILKKQLSPKVTIINLMINHVYGPTDSQDKFVPWLIKSLLANKKSLDFADGENKLDFIYIEDVVNNYMTLLELINKTKIKKTTFHDYYIGSNNEIALRELILTTKQLVEQLTKKIIITELNFGVLARKEIVKRCKENHSYVLKENHWSLKEGLKKTINYYLNEAHND